MENQAQQSKLSFDELKAIFAKKLAEHNLTRLNQLIFRGNTPEDLMREYIQWLRDEHFHRFDTTEVSLISAGVAFDQTKQS